MLAIIRHSHDGMQACVRVEWSRILGYKFDVEQSLRQGCALAPLLFNMFSTKVLRVAENRFLTDVAIMYNTVQPQRNTDKGEKKGTPRAIKVDQQGGEEEEKEAQRLWGMLYADDAGIVSRSSERLERMMTVIMTGYSVFGLMVSEAKTETMCLQTKYGERCRSQSIQWARYANKRSNSCTWVGLSSQIENSPSR